jgi:glycosyltransferase involved in cell wall biosynthesis
VSSERARFVFVSSEVPSEQSTSGFAARLHHFIAATSEHMDVTLLLVRQPGQEIDPPVEAAPGPDRVRILEAPYVAWRAPGRKGRMLRRLIHYPFDRLPFHCYPRALPDLATAIEDEAPTCVGFVSSYLVHLAADLPRDLPLIALLDEGLERTFAEDLEGPAWLKPVLTLSEARKYARLYRWAGRRAAAVTAISADEEAWFTKTIDPSKIVVIPHGIDTSYFRPLEPAEPDTDVLVVGDLRSSRNHVGAVRTWEAAAGAGWQWTFVGAVDDGVASILHAGGATVTGRVPDVRPYYQRAKVVLVPALAGTGVKTTSLQAWSMGRPLVASAVGAIGLPARHGENILIGDDPAALFEHLRAVLTDAGLAERLADEGRRTCESELDLTEIARRFADVCRDVAGASAEGAAAGHPLRGA